jgi:chemotaxis-related protein WspB
MLCLFIHAGGERLAVPAAAVTEVVPGVALHPLTGGPPWVAGVFRFRGAVTPVLDLHRLATGQPCPVKLSTRIVVLDHPTPDGPRSVGLLAERVSELKPLATTGPAYAAGSAADGPDLGPLLADADGVVRVPDLGRLVPRAYHGAVFGGGG